ncbi:MAG: hypothetical protein CVT49_15075 [candidate division Zixibacteria bacterium HGW-Zixibacteria-1]|nr:MAG: hypothetical protein CVT49_15075 [candidate division Zixibacteria bacterium HGW-Zixibacteria-1]
MSRTILTFAALGLLLLAGCSDNSTTGSNTEPTATGDIMPLAVGNIWSGTLSTYYTGGSAIDTLMYYITNDTVVNGETFYLMNLKRSGSHIPFAWLTLRDDGLYIAECKNAPSMGACELFFKHPMTVGDIYTTDLGHDGVVDTMYLASADEKITLKNKAHYCCCYYRSCQGNQYSYFISPGVGFVQTVEFTGYTYVVWTLDTVILANQ